MCDQANTVFVGLTTISTVILAIFSVLLWRTSREQWKIISAQLKEMEHSNLSQSFVSIVNYLQQKERREARKYVLCNQKDLSEWTADDREKAGLVLGTWDSIGILLKAEVIDYKLVTENWNDSILKCWGKLHPYIEELEKTGRKDRWEGFKWLYDKTPKD